MELVYRNIDINTPVFNKMLEQGYVLGFEQASREAGVPHQYYARDNEGKLWTAEQVDADCFTTDGKGHQLVYRECSEVPQGAEFVGYYKITRG